MSPWRNASPCLHIVAGLALALAAAGGARPARAAEAPRVEEVKAAFVVNFLRYTEWPAGSFEDSASPFVVIVVGSDPVAEALEAIAERSSPIAGRPLTVQRRRLPDRRSSRYVRLLDELRRSHLVYLGEELGERAGELAGDLRSDAVLTVGDPPGFAAAGGMIGLRRLGNRVVFDANPEAIKRTRLTVSARVLRLARNLEGEARS